MQEITVGLVLQRGRVNDAMRHVTPSWISRYETVCMGDTGYHALIDRIMKTIVQALSFAAEGLTLQRSFAQLVLQEILIRWVVVQERWAEMVCPISYCRHSPLSDSERGREVE